MSQKSGRVSVLKVFMNTKKVVRGKYSLRVSRMLNFKVVKWTLFFLEECDNKGKQ